MLEKYIVPGIQASHVYELWVKYCTYKAMIFPSYMRR